MVELLNKYKFFRSNFIPRLKSWIRRKIGIYYRCSYAQCGEDIIVKTIFDAMKIYHPSYLDIGAHHPCYFNNTYIFYKNGSRGINVEPDPTLYKKFKIARRRDINLNIGINKEAGTLDLNIMSARTLNTFSSAEAKTYEDLGYKIEKQVSIPVITINQLLDQYLNKSPDFLSIDVEGMDYDILNSLDFSRYRPIVICVETVEFSNTGFGRKREEIEKLIISKGYFKFADTYINSIYVDIDMWTNR
jgi:FkbM family methyltransferase